MAGVINEKDLQKQGTAQAAQPTQTASTAAVETPAAANTTNATANTAANTNLKGLSQNTSSMLNQYSQGYQQSGSVQAAQDYLNGVLNSKPVADAQLSQLYDRIMNREEFSYDLNGDALYQQYKDKYQNLGKQAMMHTMGNATSLTGGYGSSYASTAGNQAYQQYMQQLNDVVPELYQHAYNRYNQEGNNLMNQYNLAYGQHRDAMGDWEADRSFANDDYWQKYSADYSNYQNMLNYWNQMAQQENAAFYTDRDYAYNLAMKIIDEHKMPSDDILAAAGMTQEDAIALGARVSSGSSGGSRKKSSGSGNTSSDYSLSEMDVAIMNTASNVMANMRGNYSSSSAAKTAAYSFLDKAEKNGTINSSAKAKIKTELSKYY